MLFNTLRFLLFFLPVTLLVALRLKGRSLLRWLTLASFFFYAFAGHAWFLIPMLVTTILDFLVAPMIHSAPSSGRKRAWLVFSLSCNLGLLFYFKYARLVFGGSYASVILPAGISFYTFQTMSYVIDVYRGEARPETDFWTFAGFVSFFPHLVAGPLTRHDQLIPQLDAIADKGIKPRWNEGVFLFAAGLAKKVLIADRIGALIDPRINDAGSLGFAAAWLALLGYSLQIYFDFSGYSDMAVGLGRLFGIELPLNFDSPYQSRTPTEFWQRWHITLSRWLRDYLYIPLGGNRGSAVRTGFNLMATMVLGGLWHGASWTFAAWGFYHGVLLVLFRLTERRWTALPDGLQKTLTFLAVSTGWVFFRSETFDQARTWFLRLTDVFSFKLLGAGELPLAGLVAAGLLLALVFPNAARRDWTRLSPGLQVALGLATVLAVLFMNFSSRFLYFQF